MAVRALSIFVIATLLLTAPACSLLHGGHVYTPSQNETAVYSSSVEAHGTMYLAGRLGLDADGRVPDDPAQEARNALDSIADSLHDADLDMRDIVSVTVYCSDLSLYETFNDVYRGYFVAGRFPARAFVGAQLVRGARFEVAAIAVR